MATIKVCTYVSFQTSTVVGCPVQKFRVGAMVPLRPIFKLILRSSILELSRAWPWQMYSVNFKTDHRPRGGLRAETKDELLGRKQQDTRWSIRTAAVAGWVPGFAGRHYAGFPPLVGGVSLFSVCNSCIHGVRQDQDNKKKKKKKKRDQSVKNRCLHRLTATEEIIRQKNARPRPSVAQYRVVLLSRLRS